MSWVDDVDADRDGIHATEALYTPCAPLDAEPLSLPMRLGLALVFCLASDLAFQGDAVELVRMDGPDAYFTASYQHAVVAPRPGLSTSTSYPVR